MISEELERRQGNKSSSCSSISSLNFEWRIHRLNLMHAFQRTIFFADSLDLVRGFQDVVLFYLSFNCHNLSMVVYCIKAMQFIANDIHKITLICIAILTEPITIAYNLKMPQSQKKINKNPDNRRFLAFVSAFYQTF